MRRLLVGGLVLALLGVGAPVGAATTLPERAVIVAVIDTGLDATHPEFDYRGPSSQIDQIVAWWDFTNERKPASRTDPFAQGAPTWDTDIADPFDGHGHGTATASLVGGANVGTCPSAPKLSHAPGVKLAIAKVGVRSGTISGDMALAIRWATEVAHADIISISIGGTLPRPNIDPSGFDALRDARAQGVLPVVLAHNGLMNAGLLPFPSELNYWSSSPATFVVGGGSYSGDTLSSTMGNDDPDVSAWSDDVCVALANTGGYAIESGTSFATPLVAGMAARAREAALASDHDASPDRLTDILHRCARDTIAPFAREGWGFLGAPEAVCVRDHAASGTQPAYATYTGLPLNENEAYDTSVRAPLRTVGSMPTIDAGATGPIIAPANDLVNDGLERVDALLPPSTMLARTDVAPLSGPGAIGPSAPAGLAEVEAYAIHIPAGETLTALMAPARSTLGARPGIPDMDIMLFTRADFDSGLLKSHDALARSARPAGAAELLTWSAPEGIDVVLVVVGISVAGPAAFTLGATHAATILDEAYYAGSGLVVT